MTTGLFVILNMPIYTWQHAYMVTPLHLADVPLEEVFRA